MSRSRARAVPGALAALLAILGASCSLVSVEQLVVASHPSGRNMVLARGERITLSFSIPPDRARAEELARILAPDGPAGVDFHWEGTTLELLPVAELPAGERLVLSLRGELAAADGRVFTVAVQVPFFVVCAGPRPCPATSTPADGACAGVHTPLVLAFTRAMDRESFVDGFAVSPSTDFDVSWSADGCTATVAPRAQWDNLALYTWEVPGSVTDSTGVGLGVDWAGCFRTQEDAAPPVLLSLRPAAANPDGTFAVVDAVLDGNLRARDCILLSFSEDVTRESLERAFRVDPSVGGCFRRESAGEFFYVPSEPWVMARQHHLVVSVDVEDLSGNRMAAESSTWFTPDIPVQSVLSVTANGGPPLEVNGITPADVVLAVGGEIVFVVEFSQPFDASTAAAVPFAARCQAVFPLSVPDPALKSAAWGSATSLTIAFSGFSAGVAPALHYYRLLFPGGPAGIPNGDGSYLEEDAWVALVAR